MGWAPPGGSDDRLAIPNSPALIGAIIHEQALPLEFDASGRLALTSSNGLTLTVGTF